MERHTFVCVPDDHETANDSYWDYARDTLGAPDHPYTTDARYGNSPALLKQLKLDSQRAWSEYVPARVSFNPQATHPFEALKVYRRFNFGGFLDLFMIENRTYRSPHPCGEDDLLQRYFPLGCTRFNNGDRTLLGAEQLSPLNVDAWDGFVAERRALTGDLHAHMASNIKHDWSNLNPLDTGNFEGAEFMTPSVTSSTLAESLAAKADKATRILLGRALTPRKCIARQRKYMSLPWLVAQSTAGY